MNRKFLTSPASRSAFTLILLVLLLIANLGLLALPQSVSKPDLANKSTFVLSDATQKTLAELSEPVTLYFLCDGGLPSANGELYSFLKDYDESSSFLKLKVIDPTMDDAFVAAHPGVQTLSDLSVVVESEHFTKMIDNSEMYYYYNSYIGDYKMTPLEYTYFCTMLQQSSGAESLSSFVSTTVAYFDGESLLTNAIRASLTREHPLVYLLTGNQTTSLDTQLQSALSLSGYTWKNLGSTTSVPSDCDLLVINTPTTDLTEAESAGLSSYLQSGGKLFLTTGCKHTDLPNLKSILSAYGLGFEERPNVVCEENSGYCYTESTSYGSTTYPNVIYARIKQTQLNGQFSGHFVIPNAHSIQILETEGVSATPWLTATKGYLSYLDTEENEISQERVEHNMGVISQKDNSTIVWISSPDAVAATANTYSDGGNFQLLQACFHHLTGNTQSALSIEAAPISSSTLSIKAGPAVGMILIFAIVLPLSVAITGGVICYTRKKK